MEDLLVHVDEDNNIIGYGEKMETHRKGQLHRAFSVFIYDRKNQKMLIQRRARDKYHSGGLWSNACCSHPRKDELWCPALRNRLEEELGIKTVFEKCIHFAGSFKYFSQYTDIAEHEIDYVFVYYHTFENEEINFNKNEVEEIKWIGLEELESWMQEHPEEFSSWFAKAYTFFKTQQEYEESWEGMSGCHVPD